MESASFSMELNSMDLHALHMAKDTLKASMKMHVEGSSDFHQTHMLKAQADHITLHLKDTTLYPVELAARMMPPTAPLQKHRQETWNWESVLRTE